MLRFKFSIRKTAILDQRPELLVCREWLVQGILACCALIPIVGIAAIVLVFVHESIVLFQTISLWQFLTDSEWTPLFSTRKFGIGVLLSATLLVTTIAMLVAVPLGTLAAVYLSEYAPPLPRRLLKPLLEALSGIPTIVYGYFALQFVTPGLRHWIPGLPGFNALSAGLVTGMLIVPIISSLSEDAMADVPASLREGAYATGMTRYEVLLHVVLPAALPGMIASYTLAASRSLGETMIAAIAAGQNPHLTFNPLEPVGTVTAFIIQVSLGDVSADSLGFHTIFAVGLVLFLVTLTLNHVGQTLIRRYSLSMRRLFVPVGEDTQPSMHDASTSRSLLPMQDSTGRSPASFGAIVPPPVLSHQQLFQENLKIRSWLNHGMAILGFLAAVSGFVVFLLLLFGTFQAGLSQLDWHFLTNFASRDPNQAGIAQALMGTLWLIGLSTLLMAPVGIGAAIYLEEYLPEGRLNRWLELNIANAAAIPSVLYGILGLALFVRRLEPFTGGRSLLSAALVMATIALPLLIIAARAALRTVPEEFRQAGYAVGMTRSQLIWNVALPQAMPGIITGLLLAISRIIGETSALLAIGALAFISFSPPLSLEGIKSPFTTLPTQIFFWALRPQPEFRANAAAAIIVLGILVLLVNITAVMLRDMYRRQTLI